MSNNNPGTLEIIAIEFAKIFNPLEERISSGQILTLLAELGIEFPDSLASDSGFSTAITNIVNNLKATPDLVSAIIKAVEDEEYATMAEKSVDLVTKIVAVVNDMDTVADAIKAKKNDFIADGLSAQDVENFALEFAKNLLDYLIVNYVESNVPALAAGLEFFGIFERTEENVGSTNALKPPYTKRVIHFNNILEFFKSPTELLKSLYDWGKPDFDGVKLLQNLNKVLLSVGLPVIYNGSAAPPTLDLFMAELKPKTDISPKGLQLILSETIKADVDYEIKQDEWSLIFGLGADMPVQAGIIIQPNGNLTVIPPSGSVSGKTYVRWVAKDNTTGKPFPIIGDPQASRLEAKEVSFEAGVDFKWDGASNASGVFHVEAEIKEGKIIIKPGSPDGFLAKILPEKGFEIGFGFIVGISSDKGFYFKNSGVLQIDFPTSISLGPIEIKNLSIGISPDSSKFSIALGATIKTELGPLTAIVENMGMKANFAFPEDRKGNLGTVDFDLDFKPPNGIALSLDTGAVKGGGYLFFDFENERYAGAIELSFADSFAFSAIGLITTRFPDGSKGFSLLILVNVKFGTPIALGLNFYLAAVGGLLGLHRTIYVDELRKGVQSGAIDNIMFPENVIANITTIVTDLRKVFPPEKDQFVIGLMAMITWNVPPVVTVELGLIIEFPSPLKIAILGVLKSVLPNPDAPIIKIQVNFLGIIDFEKEMLSFDASIVNSKILCITLEGDMALRLSWGQQKDFLLSVGGFHPAYSPPSYLMLPTMKRMTISLLSGNPNLCLTSYFAITTNTVQFGAALDFSFKISKFGVYGHFSFDVLFQFSPFHFIAQVSASVDVKLGSSTLFSIGLTFELSGPTPWRAKGTAKFKILFISFKVKFDKTFGEKREVSLPGTEILPLIIEAFEKESNWQAELPANRYMLVTMDNSKGTSDQVIVHPFGTLTTSQSLVPLSLEMSMFGNYIPLDISLINIKSIEIADEEMDFEYVKDSFAPSSYKKMEDDDKLSAPSYEQQKSGIKVKATDKIKLDYSINRKVKYEVIVSDYEEEPVIWADLQAIGMDNFKPFIFGGEIGKSALSQKNKNKKAIIENTVSFDDEIYTIVNNENLSKHKVGNKTFAFSSKSEADEQLKQIFNEDPSLKGKLQLVPEYELSEV